MQNALLLSSINEFFSGTCLQTVLKGFAWGWTWTPQRLCRS